ncbi:hypothetical protein BBJ28_00000262 [Nothophytophthora sp. Chile5]|nr:hypothetical protein BBJ28_00000262 [Nothophytophthora sp. Chile5]
MESQPPATTARGQQQHEAPVMTAPLAPPPCDQPSVEAALKAKRPARERQRKERFALLHSMTADERRRFLVEEDAQKEQLLRKLERVVAPDSTSQRIAIDLSFDHIMNEKEIRSLANQLKISYGIVKQMHEPFQLIFCNANGSLQRLLEGFGADHWFIQWRHNVDSLDEVFQSSELVYLSPDSPNVLSSMDPKKTYVIGGIVDKSRKKGATLNAATQVGITTARLPIREHIPERLDHILNVNTVVEVLQNFQELGDWQQALEKALPQQAVMVDASPTEDVELLWMEELAL